MQVRPIEEKDIRSCLDIYNYYIENTRFTFEIEPLTEAQFYDRVKRFSSRYPYIVCEKEGKVIGYAYLDPFGERYGYRYTADLAIYVDKDCRGSGAGKALVDEIVRLALEQTDIRDIIAVVTDENEASLRFHERNGFIEEGHLYKVGDKFGKRIGVVHMHRYLRPDTD